MELKAININKPTNQVTTRPHRVFFLSGKCPSTNQIINLMLDLISQISKEETQYATERNTASHETDINQPVNPLAPEFTFKF